MTERRTRVLFVCTGNSARSQMAEALLRWAYGGRFDVASAGTAPQPVHPLTIRALAGIGVDGAGARSKSVNELLGQSFDYVITVCDDAREACPVFPGEAAREHWSLEDPARATGTEAERLAAFERIRDEIATRLAAFVAAIRGPGEPEHGVEVGR